MWALATHAKTTHRELTGRFSSYVGKDEKKVKSPLDPIAGVLLQSPPLDLLATGKYHQAMKAPLGRGMVSHHATIQVELFSFPRCLMAGRSERFGAVSRTRKRRL
jgi:hypothetical protein